MAGNIKIIGNILDTTTVSRYSPQDTNLISSTTIQENFGKTGDYIEYYIYDVGGNLLVDNYNYLSYKLPSSNGLSPAAPYFLNTTGEIQINDIGIESTLASTTGALYPIIEIDPIADVQNQNYSSGEFNTTYNFFSNVISNNIDRALFIKEISQDRTEIRLASVSPRLPNDALEFAVNSMINQINSSSYYVDYLLNFGNNKQYVAVNVALNKANPEGYEVLFKMYEPLPPEIQLKQTLWVVQEKTSPYIFNINLNLLITPPLPPRLRGPNFDIPLPEQGTISTVYTNYNTAIASLQALQNSSYQQLLNLMNTQSIAINVDYTNFNNFVFFGSAYQRVSNFYNKVKQIEDYNTLINEYTPFISTVPSLQAEVNNASASINTLISQFDGFEYYLYFNSGSILTSSLDYGITPYPKSGSLLPFTLQSTGSSEVLTWYNWVVENSSEYDYYNTDNLIYAVPDFIRDDENNAPFLTFLNMVGQYFDNIWIYFKAITDVNLANNNLNVGISKDLVYNQLQSLGIKLYNSQAGEAVDQFLIGDNSGSSIFDNDFSPTGSYLNNIPRKDLLSELYKRIYHNLPLLLKTKGTKAGLDYLISLFGIPSRTYYTITSGSINTTWYTPTGSLVSESILNIKEYGGGLKSNLIKGYNDEKVRIVANTITGSVLSPLLSLQTFPTNSNEFRENDNHFVDISFSPETQINTYASSAIASNNPDWRLDDYIGDPRQLYSETYPDLYEQRKLYYETGVAGYPGFTSSLLDYNGFIRLIQFFDNALFKMLSDFVPERTSLSTGITIESPVLERNKVVYPIPDPLNQEVYDADYPTPTISSPYDDLYYNLGDDKVAYFDGAISGSELNTYAYFEETNFNPYLGDWDVYNAQHPPTESINLNKFNHSDYNVLFNNVSRNVTSQYRKKIEYIWGTTGSLTSSVELQDSYLTLQSYNNSRYKGTQLTSKLINTYTSASYSYLGLNGPVTQNGDISYGLTAVIDRNSYKLGWIQALPTQSLNFYYKTPINLKYLVDTKSDITDLNSSNNNVIEVQNIFKSGKPAILSITDKNQRRRDGQKVVWRGGYRFDPILYRENGEILTFRYDNYISTSSLNLGFLTSDLNSYEYEANVDGNSDYTPNSTIQNLPLINRFYINEQVAFTTPNGDNRVAPEVFTAVTWKYNNPNLYPTLAFSGSRFNQIDYNPINNKTYRFNLFKFGNFITPNAGARSVELNETLFSSAFNTEPILESINNNIYRVTRPGKFKLLGSTEVLVTIVGTGENKGKYRIFKMALLIEKANVDQYYSNKWQEYQPLAEARVTFSNIFSPIPNDPNTRLGDGSIYMPAGSTLPDASIAQFTFDFHDQIITAGSEGDVDIGDYIRLSFYFIDSQEAYRYLRNINLKFSNTCWGVANVDQIITTYNYESQYAFANPIFVTASVNQTNDTLVFNPPFTTQYFYSASFVGSSPNYSEILDKMSIERGDLIKFGRFEDPGEYYEVIKVKSSGSILSPRIYATLNSSIPVSSNNISTDFAILRPKPDETSVILEGRRAFGTEQVIQSLLIPHDASSTLTNNVGKIIIDISNSV